MPNELESEEWIMAEVVLAEVFEKVQQVYQLYDEGKLYDAKTLTLRIEALQSGFEDEHEKAICRKYVAPCLIDIGSAVNDEAMVKRGTSYFRNWVDNFESGEELAHELYNVANGYLSSWKFNAANLISDAIDAEEHRLARHFYRKSLQKLQPRHYAEELACLVWVNYGNALDSVGRSIEAIDAYDVALRINPNMGMALGNKGVAISYLAPVMYGHTHLFFLEAIRLLQEALEQPLPQEAKAGFTGKLADLTEFQKEHGEMNAEKVKGIEPVTDFHRFLCEFCARFGLFLNPVSFLGQEKRAYYGDPMFVSTMYASLDDIHKFDRYITFLNEIKQDYVLGRYMLVQSQFVSHEIDAVDVGVSLFCPLDYSLHGSYLQLLKAAKRQAIVVLDKIAYFIYDYCNLTTPKSDRVTFRQIFGGNDKIRKDFGNYSSPHLFALFGLAQDVSKKGDWHTIYEHRDELTHRFLVVHEFQRSDQPNADIPRINLDEFLNNTILAFKIARAAITYLILFVEHQEHIAGRKNPGITAPIFATPLDNIFRYRPK